MPWWHWYLLIGSVLYAVRLADPGSWKDSLLSLVLIPLWGPVLAVILGGVAWEWWHEDEQKDWR